MKVMRRVMLAATCAALWCAVPAQAQVKGLPISADQAFDAVQMQKDPMSGIAKKVLLVDIRTRAEVNWIGTAAQVTSIVMKRGETIVPDYGKVKLGLDGLVISYSVNGRYRFAFVQQVASMTTAPIAYSIPVKLWNEASGAIEDNTPEFQEQINRLAGTDHPVLIIFCRSGDRSDVLIQNPELFDAVYEIEEPSDPKSGFGGFEGNLYNGIYNGYRGFPGRVIDSGLRPSASWKDAGLPIVIGKAFPVPTPPVGVPVSR